MSEVSLPRQEVVYNRNRPLESIFKNSPARVLDFLILNQNFDYSASEISTITGIPLRTVQRVMPHLVQKELVKETGKIGNTRMYIINSKSELSELLRQYILTRINIDIDKTRKQQGISNKNKNNNNSLMVEQIEQSDIYVSK
jgi:DNA-binding transcriptional regulator GbsR (MarR family)